MSGSTIGGVVGGVIGFVVSGYNPQGAQIGFAIGSMIGGALDPQVLQGPQLGDIPVQTSQEGVPRPIIYGSPQPFPGNLIMTGPKIFSTKKTRQGKGGPIIESEEVHQTYAIRICEGPAVCIQIFRDGKLVFDRTGTVALDADSAAFNSKLNLYEGDESQLPAPPLEALPAAHGGGVGNVNAHRGTAYAIVNHDNLTPTGGRIPNYEFRMASSATLSPGQSDETWIACTQDGLLAGQDLGFSEDGVDWTSLPVDFGAAGGNRLLFGGGILLNYGSTSGKISYDYGETWSASYPAIYSDWKGVYLDSLFWLIADGFSEHVRKSADGLAWTGYLPPLTGGATAVGGDHTLVMIGSNTGHINRTKTDGSSWEGEVLATGGPYVTAISVSDQGEQLPFIVIGTNNGGLLWSDDEGATWTSSTSPFTVGQDVLAIRYGGGFYVATCEDGQVAYGSGKIWTLATTTDLGARDLEYDGTKFVCVGRDAVAGNIIATSPDGNIWTVSPNNFTTHTLSSVEYMACPGVPIPDAPGYFVDYAGNICGPGMDIATPGTVFLSDIELDIADRCGLEASKFDVSEITAIEVQGYLIGKQVTGSGALAPLATAYFHDLPEYDLQIHARRRGQPSEATLSDDDFVETGEDEEIRAQAIELPRKLNLYFSDPAANYAVVPVPAERVSINVKATGIAAVQVPLVLDRNLAKQKAEIMLKCVYEESQGKLIRELPAYKYADLVASDPITYDSKRWRIDKLEQGEGTIKIEAFRDRVSNYASAATANGVLDPSDPVSSIRGPSVLQALNLPRLLTQDNQPGMYLGVTGLLPGWAGADIYLSVDGGVTEELLTTIVGRATMGRLTAAITASSDPITVEVFDNRDLFAATDEELADRRNAFAITTLGTSEVGQFGNVSQNVDDTWDLTAPLYRGQLGTDATSHDVGDQFLLLDGAVKFQPLSSALIGKTLIFRAVSRGTPPANNPTITVVFQPLFTGPEEIEYLLDETGAQLLDETDANLLEE